MELLYTFPVPPQPLDDIERIADFIQKYAPQYFDKDKVKKYIEQHLLHKTAFVIYDPLGEIVAICRWNIIDGGKKAEILDLCCREDYRNNGIIKEMLEKGLWNFPTVKEIGWRRETRNHKGLHFYPVDKILKRRI